VAGNQVGLRRERRIGETFRTTVIPLDSETAKPNWSTPPAGRPALLCLVSERPAVAVISFRDEKKSAAAGG
jgi:hypothetical protein